MVSRSSRVRRPPREPFKDRFTPWVDCVGYPHVLCIDPLYLLDSFHYIIYPVRETNSHDNRALHFNVGPGFLFDFEGDDPPLTIL